MDLSSNIHQGLPLPGDVPQGSELLIKGNYLYYHYGCDGEDDRVCKLVGIQTELNVALDPVGELGSGKDKRTVEHLVGSWWSLYSRVFVKLCQLTGWLTGPESYKHNLFVVLGLNGNAKAKAKERTGRDPNSPKTSCRRGETKTSQMANN